MDPNSNWLIIIDIIYKLASVFTLGFLAYQIKQANVSNKLANEEFTNKKKEDEIRHQKEEREKAIKLAELYANKLVHNIAYLNGIYKKIGVEEKLRHIRYDQLIEFDKYELEKIFSKDLIDEINNLLSNIDDDILINAALNLGNRIGEDWLNDFMEAKATKTFVSEYNNEVQKEIASTLTESDLEHFNEMINREKRKNAYYNLYYNRLYLETLQDTLNTLEYFCMYFNSGVADEETVYQSLHQSFLAMVKILYFSIASKNESGKDKYFTNIIELYNNWAYRYQLQRESEINASRENTYKKEKIKR